MHGTISARLPNLSAVAVEHVPQRKTAPAQPSSRPSGGANRRQRLLVCGLYGRCADARSAFSHVQRAWRFQPWSIGRGSGHQLAWWALQHGIDLEFIQPGKPTQNSYVERFNRTFREEVLNFYVFSRLSEIRTIVDAWVQEYNEQRPHESLGNLTPEEFALKHAGGSSLALH